MNGIIRVFPRRTEMTPLDDMSFSRVFINGIGDDSDLPTMFIPDHDAVHICCVFTWDKHRAEELQYQWQGKTDKPVLIGGPAYDADGGEFVPGMYMRQGVTITSRGCNNQCPWCFAWRREGRLRELPVHAGNVEQSNNFLQCSIKHRRTVYDMMKTQSQISFRGGLETALLTNWDIEEMRSLRIADLWLACDTKGAIKKLRSACQRLHNAGFSQNKIRCYVLIGDDMAENESRLRQVYEAGALPFAQLFQPETPIEYSTEWKQFARTWSRPAAYKSKLKKERS
ncbi:MAG: hypothetical protein K0Q85_4 [Caproiciproducens sp.]|nr:hypothetical protein [Caproiciproducens sp.]